MFKDATLDPVHSVTFQVCSICRIETHEKEYGVKECKDASQIVSLIHLLIFLDDFLKQFSLCNDGMNIKKSFQLCKWEYVLCLFVFCECRLNILVKTF